MCVKKKKKKPSDEDSQSINRTYVTEHYFGFSELNRNAGTAKLNSIGCAPRENIKKKKTKMTPLLVIVVVNEFNDTVVDE